MIKHFSVKCVAALLALWCAWSLGTLALRLQNAAEVLGLQEKRMETIREEIAELERARSDPEGVLRSLGYVYRGDRVFFDGG